MPQPRHSFMFLLAVEDFFLNYSTGPPHPMHREWQLELQINLNKWPGNLSEGGFEASSISGLNLHHQTIIAGYYVPGKLSYLSVLSAKSEAMKI